MTGLLSRCGGMERVVPMVPGEQRRRTLMMMTWFYCWVLNALSSRIAIVFTGFQLQLGH